MSNFQAEDLAKHMTEFIESTHVSDSQGKLDSPIDWQSATNLDEDPEEEHLSITEEQA